MRQPDGRRSTDPALLLVAQSTTLAPAIESAPLHQHRQSGRRRRGCCSSACSRPGTWLTMELTGPSAALKCCIAGADGQRCPRRSALKPRPSRTAERERRTALPPLAPARTQPLCRFPAVRPWQGDVVARPQMQSSWPGCWFARNQRPAASPQALPLRRHCDHVGVEVAVGLVHTDHAVDDRGGDHVDGRPSAKSGRQVGAQRVIALSTERQPVGSGRGLLVFVLITRIRQAGSA
jgi:hypothetical protein